MREFLKKYPNFYYMIVRFFGPALIYFYDPKWFIKKYNDNGFCINLGSGPKVINNNFKNVDLFKYEKVDYVCDISKTPFENNTVDRIILDNVLEHIGEPEKVVGEMFRIMKNNSLAYISVPFIYPFHSSPYDFNRWTHLGLKKIFERRGFEVVEIGTRSGIFSTLNTILVYIFATIFSFGNEKLYDLLSNLFIFVFFPIKFLDLLVLWIPQNINSACVFYMVVKKN